MDPITALRITVVIVLATGAIITSTLAPGDSITVMQSGTPETFMIPTPTATHVPPTPPTEPAITGRVTLPDGAGLAGVTVGEWTTTDATGHYTITASGTWTVWVTLPGYAVIPATRVVTSPASGVDFVAYAHTPTPAPTDTPTPEVTPTPQTPREFVGIVVWGEPSTFDALWDGIVGGRWFATTIDECAVPADTLQLEFYADDGRGYPVTTDMPLSAGLITFTVAVSPSAGIVHTEIRDEVGILRAESQYPTLTYSAEIADLSLYAEAVRSDGHRVRSAPFYVDAP